jgi:uncharacterized OB-fold protein
MSETPRQPDPTQPDLTRPEPARPALRDSGAQRPPAQRSRAALGLTAAAARGRFELQVCAGCGTVQYPPREACHRCLAVELLWRPQSGAGELLCETVLHHSFEPYFRDRLPWRLGMVRLDCGPTVIVHLPGSVPAAPCRVRIVARLDRSDRAALIAVPAAHDGSEEAADMANDPHLQDLIAVSRTAGELG